MISINHFPRITHPPSAQTDREVITDMEADFPTWEPGIRRNYPTLRGERQADVLIVGGGLTGDTCAALLTMQGARVVLLEAQRLGMGDSFACTGKVTSQLAGVYTTVAKTVGMDAASAYARLMREAVLGVRALCDSFHLPCQPREQDVYVFAETEDDLSDLQALSDLEAKLGIPAAPAPDAGGCPFPAELSLRTPHQLTLSPLPYLLGLIEAAEAQGCEVYEQSPVRAIDGRRATTPGGSVEAAWIVLATGSPIGCTSLPRLAMMQQHACTSVVLQGGAPLHASHLSVQPDEMTLRPIPGGALLAWDMGRAGTRQHETRNTILERTLKALLPEYRVQERILRQDVWSGDGLPLIGSIRPEASHLLMAAGYSGWGIANAYLAARIITGQIMGRPLPEASLFRPDRRYPGHAGVMLREGTNVAGGYLSSLLRPGAPICTHMSGRLRYNLDSGRWECPCHGSAFTVMGETLTGPAMEIAKVSAHQRQ